MLLSRPGEAVGRDELRARLWPSDVFVDFDHSLNSAVSKLRDALHDTASRPQYIETLPRGYRFIAAVAGPPPVQHRDELDAARAAAANGSPEPVAMSEPALMPAPAPAPQALSSAPPRPRRLRVAAWLVGSIAVASAAWVVGSKLPVGQLMPAETVALAVLPFQNLSGDPEQEFFSDGITDEMITQLGRLDPERLRVIARTSAMHYKRTDKRADEIGAELGVAYLLEGSVRRAGSRIRVTAHLVRVRDQVRLWAQSYERELDDILALQTEVARSIAAEIAVTFEQAPDAPPPPRPRVSPAVYEAYLKGRYFLDKSPGPSALARSIEYFEEALRLDPTHAAAYAGLADAYGILGWGFSDGLPPREAYPKALAAAERALALDRQLAAAHVALARIRWKYEWNWTAAEATFKRAIELDPSAAAAHESYFDYLSAMGRHDEAFVELQRAAALDPVSFTINYDFGLHFARTGDVARAVDRLQRASELDPSSGFVHHLLGQVYASQRRYGESIAELEKAVALAPSSPQFLAALGHVRALSGDRAAAVQALETLQARARSAYVSPYALAILHVGLGNKDAALDMLDAAYLERDPWLSILRVQPRVQSLHADPRFEALLVKIGLGPTPPALVRHSTS
jgi:TolB-like protein/Tfp pilus assembly protein PilF